MGIRCVLEFMATFVLLFAVLLGSLTLNILVHEVGHYVVAESFDLDPHMHFLNPVGGGTGFSVATLQSEPVAYVQFSHTSDAWELVSIGLAGVFLNAILALIITFVFRQMKPTADTKTLYLALVIPCILAILLNINIFNPLSDGAMVWDVLKGLL